MKLPIIILFSDISIKIIKTEKVFLDWNKESNYNTDKCDIYISDISDDLIIKRKYSIDPKDKVKKLLSGDNYTRIPEKDIDWGDIYNKIEKSLDSLKKTDRKIVKKFLIKVEKNKLHNST